MLARRHECLATVPLQATDTEQSVFSVYSVTFGDEYFKLTGCGFMKVVGLPEMELEITL